MRHRGTFHKFGIPFLGSRDGSVLKTEDRKPAVKARLDELAAFLRNPESAKSLQDRANEIFHGGSINRPAAEVPFSSQQAYPFSEQDMLAFSRMPSQYLWEAAPLLPRSICLPGTIACFGSVRRHVTGSGQTVLRLDGQPCSWAGGSGPPKAVQLALDLHFPGFNRLDVTMSLTSLAAGLELLLKDDDGTCLPTWDDIRNGIEVVSDAENSADNVARMLSIARSSRKISDGANLAQFAIDTSSNARIVSSAVCEAIAGELTEAESMDLETLQQNVLERLGERGFAEDASRLFTEAEWEVLSLELASALCFASWVVSIDLVRARGLNLLTSVLSFSSSTWSRCRKP